MGDQPEEQQHCQRKQDALTQIGQPERIDNRLKHALLL
jgi:hypothetical protein